MATSILDSALSAVTSTFKALFSVTTTPDAHAVDLSIVNVSVLIDQGDCSDAVEVILGPFAEEALTWTPIISVDSDRIFPAIFRFFFVSKGSFYYLQIY